MLKLRKVKRNALDENKYSNAIDQAINYRIYAECWYLDVLTDKKWECWVYGDYEAVMPVPLQYKFGIKFVIQPFYCQQLGVFYSNEISNELFKAFETKLHKYRVRAYHFNEENTDKYRPEGEKRVNFILDLDRPYDDLFANYSKSRRKDIRKSKRLGVKIETTHDFDNFMKIKFTNYSDISGLNKDYFHRLLSEMVRKNKLIICDIFDENNQLIASQLFSISGNRRICLGFARDKEKEKHNSSAFAKDFLIHELSNTPNILDFEGSSHPNIANFMKGFGVEEKHFTCFSNSKFDSIKNKVFRIFNKS